VIRLLRLMRIDLMRGYGWLVAPIIAWLGYGMSANLLSNRGGLVIWADIDRIMPNVGTYVGCFGLAYAAWATGRQRRLNIEAIERSTAATPGTSAISTICACAVVTATAYLGAAVWFLRIGFTEATWGGPTIPAYVVGGVTSLLLTIIGGIVGMRFASPLAPFLALACAWVVQAYAQSFEENVRLLQVVPLAWSHRAPYAPWVVSWEPGAPWIFALYLVALAAGGMATVFAIRQFGSRQRIALVAALVIATGSGGYALAAPAQDSDAAVDQPWDLECRLAPETGIEICLHPAFTKLEADLTAHVDAIYGPIAGLAGVPNRIEQIGPVRDTMTPSSQGVVSIYASDSWALDTIDADLISPVFFAGPRRTDAVCVIAIWLAADSEQQLVCNGHMMGSRSWEASAFFPDGTPAEPAASDAVFAKVQSFGALTPEQQRAWLVANWNALRAGELTLEDLP
jgi:hypothetical protein